MAAAPPGLSFSIAPRMRTEVTSDSKGRLPESRTSEPYSPIARAKESAAPAAIAGTRLGRTTRRKTCTRVAPSEAAASSTSGSSSSSTGCTVRTTKGSVTKRKAR
jgi:hypothetical protein